MFLPGHRRERDQDGAGRDGRVEAEHQEGPDPAHAHPEFVRGHAGVEAERSVQAALNQIADHDTTPRVSFM